MLKKLLQNTIAKLKHDSDYRLESNYTGRQLFCSVFYRGLNILRGLRYRLFFAKLTGLCFVGRKVKIEHAYMVQAGSSLILEDNVFLNGLSERGILLGNNVTIARNSCLVCTGVIARKGVGITIGNNCSIGALSFLGGQGGITIGNDVIMGAGLKIFSEDHNFEKVDVLIRKQGETRKGVHIDNDCWIGAGVTIVDGVTIGKGCVVGAGAVVTKDIPEYSIAAGVPARVIKNRR